MNSDTHETLSDLLKKAGVVVLCSICKSNYIYADDEDTGRMAYAMATNAWKDGERGFRGMSREEVLSAVKGAIADANLKCPSCGKDWG